MVLTQVLGFGSLVIALLIVLILGMLLTSVWAWAIERLAYRPLRGSFRLAPMISAIGMSIFLSNLVQVTQGPRNKPVPSIFGDLHGHSVLQADSDRCSDRWAAGGLLVRGAEDLVGSRPACLRAGSAHGRSPGCRRRSHHLADVRDGRGAGGRRRPDVHDLLRG